MQPWQTVLAHQLEELHLIQCSLLSGERFAFVLPDEDLAVWSSLLDAFTNAGGISAESDSDDGVIASLTDPPRQARFEVRVLGMQTWFEVTLPQCTEIDADTTGPPLTISLKGEHVSRETHERWNVQIAAQIAQIDEGCAFPVYEVLSQLATLHASDSSDAPVFTALSPPPFPVPVSVLVPSDPLVTPSQILPPHHALLTSHHLISPTKRRTMHYLATYLDLAGFAKVGYPGIIYVEGTREGVEAFVREVKGMQWLALRVRFVEPVPVPEADGRTREQKQGWVEVSRVGEVLELMRMRGREDLVTSLGIGAPSKDAKR